MNKKKSTIFIFPSKHTKVNEPKSIIQLSQLVMQPAQSHVCSCIITYQLGSRSDKKKIILNIDISNNNNYYYFIIIITIIHVFIHFLKRTVRTIKHNYIE